MEFTGERYIPTEKGEIRLEHSHRYAAVLDIVRNKDVLDIACGEGYGSFLMAEVARTVTGIDISGEAIRHACGAYDSRPNLTFCQGDATESGLAGASFDVAVSFETIEHVVKQRQMLAEIRRLLRPDGVLVISSPNRPVYSDGGENVNPFHVCELDFNELDVLVKTYFPAVRYFGQQLMIGSIIQPIDGSQSSFRAWHDNGSDFKLGSSKVIDPVYFLAVCAEHESILPQLDASVLYPDQLDLLTHYRGIAKWTRQTGQELDQLRQKYRNEIGQYRNEIGQYRNEIEAIRLSFSWRFTEPLRAARSHLNRIQSAMNRGWRYFIWASLRRAYQYMPLKLKSRRALHAIVKRWLPGLYWKLMMRTYGGAVELSTVNPYPFHYPVSSPPTNQLNLLRVVSNKPLVSIVIPVYGKFDYTFRCLESIQMQKTSTPFEVIIIDDSSPDDTATILAKVTGLTIVSNQANLGFVRSCNAGAVVAKGEFIVFLNNDTVVLEGWLDTLVNTFSMYPTAGLVGSKLLYPDGRLQEAGGIIWNDATGWNYGRLDNPGRPEFSYVREVDYCSGASIAIRRELFHQIDGFDERYTPAYYEDVDLAFAVRKAGYQVLYQPASQVMHYEGITSGTDVNSGVKSYQITNRTKFIEKWSDRLATHRRPGEMPSLERDRFARGRILIIDAATPTPDQDAGSVTASFFQKIFVEFGYKVTFAPENLCVHDRYTQDLLQLGVECLYAPYVLTLEAYLKKHGHEFDFVLLYRAWTAYNHIKNIKSYCPKAKIIFNTVDLHHLREEREAMLTGSEEMADQAKRTKAVEFELMRAVDITIVLSETEIKLLHAQDKGLRLVTIPLLLEIYGSKTRFDQRKDIIFLGGFAHPPNIDAVEHFVKDIWPLVHSSLPDARFLIIGSRMPECMRALEECDGVVAVGFVQDLAEYFNHCKISVVPLRFGAGIKGKIGTSASYGVPTVATSIGAEGMGMVDGEHILVADTIESFADKVVSLYSDESLWNGLSQGGLDFVAERYSLQTGKKRLASLLTDLTDLDQTRIDNVEAFEKRQMELAQVLSTRVSYERGLLQPKSAPFNVEGYCRVCDAQRHFKVDYVAAYQTDEQGFLQPNWRETLICDGCGLNNRIRAALDLFINTLRPHPMSRIYVTEQLTPCYRWLKNAFPSTIGSEFLGEDISCGLVHDGLRHEDLTHLSFQDGSIDFILCFDVLEHVPNYFKAIAECARCLTENGTLLLSAPFISGAPNTLIRACVSDDGRTECLVPPEYHGNPTLSSEGSLCYYHFGWDLLDTLREQGFKHAHVQTLYSRRFGYLGEEQIFLIAKK